MVTNKSERIKNWVTNKKNWKLILGPLLIVATLFVAARTVDLNQYLEIVRNWVWQFGPWGAVAFVTMYIAATLFFLPGLPFTLMAAFLFGSFKGFLIMVAASNLTAVAGFMIARYVARKAFEHRIRSIESFHKLKVIVEKNQWLAIPFIRLMPIFPFSLNNYALGLMRISFWRYLLFSEIIFIPMNAVWVFGANTLYYAVTSGNVSWKIMGGATAAGLLVLAIGYAGKRAFGQEVSSDGTSNT